MGAYDTTGMITIDLTGIEQVPVRFMIAPHGDATGLAANSLHAFDGRVSASERAAVLSALRSTRSGGLGLRMFMDPMFFGHWEGLMPLAPLTRESFQDFDTIDRNDDGFRDLMERMFDDRLTPAWRSVLAKPGPFFDSYVNECDAAWRAFQPRLGDPQPILDREVQRLSHAIASGTLPELLVSLMPKAELHGRCLAHPARRTAHLTVAESGVTIGPIINGVRSTYFESHPGTFKLAGILYTAPGVRRRLRGEAYSEAAADSLVALLGRPRTRILGLLDRATPVSALAGLLNTGPSGITYHVDALVAAGLVTRHRRGRQVLIVRTTRGDQLLDLYSV